MQPLIHSRAPGDLVTESSVSYQINKTKANMKMQIKQLETEKRKMERLNDTLKKKLHAVRRKKGLLRGRLRERRRLGSHSSHHIVTSSCLIPIPCFAASQNLEAAEKSQPGASHWINEGDRCVAHSFSFHAASSISPLI
jgi:hypothetical protein